MIAVVVDLTVDDRAPDDAGDVHRVAVENHQVGVFPDLNGTEPRVKAKLACRVQRRKTERFVLGEPAPSHPGPGCEKEKLSILIAVHGIGDAARSEDGAV